MENTTPIEDQTVPPSQPSGDVTPIDTTPPGDDQPGKRTAEARINELVAKTKELEKRLHVAEARVPAPPVAPATPTEPVTPEVEKAIDYLKRTGKFVDQTDLNRQIQDMRDRMTLDSEHQRLETAHNGKDGRPTYNKFDIEKYMRDNGVYNPESAYKLMHEPELLDWELKHAKPTAKPFIARPNSPSSPQDEATITREKINEWLTSGPEGRAKYEQNRTKILELMGKGQL